MESASDAQMEAFSYFAESLTIGEQVMCTTITGVDIGDDPDPSLMMRALATIALQRLAQPGDPAITPSVADGLTMARIRPHADTHAAAIEATRPFREANGRHGDGRDHRVPQ